MVPAELGKEGILFVPGARCPLEEGQQSAVGNCLRVHSHCCVVFQLAG